MLVEMKNIVMEFGPVRAVDNVDFTVNGGEIVGLLGENGAGKSTLMNVLAGTYIPTSGEVYIDHKKVSISNPRAAAKHGIRFIHQELNLCNDLKVYENMFLADEIKKGLLLDKKEMIRKANETFKRMNVSINPESEVSELSASEKQLVEIAKALLFDCQLIIMDEPSTALSTDEIENLFVIMKELKLQGVSFIYISHKMPELFEICDTYYVLRDGKNVANGLFSETDESSITEMMIGRQLLDDSFADHVYNATDEVALKVKDITSSIVKNINFTLHRGEILAITGLQGSGREELADILFGNKEYTGEIYVGSKKMSPHAGVLKFMKSGVALVPRMRKERGILNDLSIYDNTSIAYLNTKHKKPLISTKAEKARFERQKQAMSIKVDNANNAITSLSGGNQQKVILGRWLEADADVLLFDNPTQGIDVGTKFEIYHLILNLAKAGKAVIVFSQEFPEIFKVADSCLVLYKGEVNAALNRDELTEKNVMYYSTGANLEGLK